VPGAVANTGAVLYDFPVDSAYAIFPRHKPHAVAAYAVRGMKPQLPARILNLPRSDTKHPHRLGRV
jgi:hypothetical protein